MPHPNLTALPFALACLAAGAACAQPRHMEATGSSLGIDSSCARQVTIQPDASLSGRAVVDANADHPEETAQLVFDSGRAAKLHVAAEHCWRPTVWSGLPTLNISVRVPPGFPIDIEESGGVEYQLGDIGGPLELDLSGGVRLHGGRATSLQADLSGGGEITLASLDGNVKAEISGGSTIAVKTGSLPALSLDISGGGGFQLDAGTVGKLELDLSGGGGAKIGATVGDAALEVSGGGTVNIAKVTGNLTKDVSGSASVNVGQ
jgi:hypothetical protein